MLGFYLYWLFYVCKINGDIERRRQGEYRAICICKMEWQNFTKSYFCHHMIQDEKSNNLHWVKFKIWFKLISINNNKSETSSWDDSGWEEQQLALGGSEGRRPSPRRHKGDTSVSPKDNLLSFKQFIFHPSKDDLLYLSKDRPWEKRRSSLCCKSQGCWRPLGRRWVSPISLLVETHF